MIEAKVRLAQKSDKEAVLAFCQILPNNQKDYIYLVWDRWITDPEGCLFVATIEDTPVAMIKVDQNNQLESIVIESKSETSQNKFWIGYISGNPETFGTLLQGLKKLAYQKKCEYIGGFLPLNEIFTTSFSEAEYEMLDSENCCIYEKNIN